MSKNWRCLCASTTEGTATPVIGCCGIRLVAPVAWKANDPDPVTDSGQGTTTPTKLSSAYPAMASPDSTSTAISTLRLVVHVDAAITRGKAPRA